MKSYAERVANGAAWLDETRPDWVNEIDLGRLDLRECKQCVLGQLVTMERDRCPYVLSEDGGWSSDDLIGYDAVVEDSIEDFTQGMMEVLEQVDDLSALVMTSAEAQDRGFHTGGSIYDGINTEWVELTDEWRRVIEARRANA